MYLDVRAPRPPLPAIHGPNPTLLVKYNYKSNPDQPGGFPELTVKQGQKVTFLNVHESEPLWWNVRDEDGGQCGYIPGSYVMVCNKNRTGMDLLLIVWFQKISIVSPWGKFLPSREGGGEMSLDVQRKRKAH